MNLHQNTNLKKEAWENKYKEKIKNKKEFTEIKELKKSFKNLMIKDVQLLK